MLLKIIVFVAKFNQRSLVKKCKHIFCDRYLKTSEKIDLVVNLENYDHMFIYPKHLKERKSVLKLNVCFILYKLVLVRNIHYLKIVLFGFEIITKPSPQLKCE